LRNELDRIDRDNVVALGKLRKEFIEISREFRKKFISPALTAEEVYAKILAIESRPDRHILTGVDWWDEFAGPFRRGNTYVLAGYPGAGKSTLALNLAWGMAKLGRKVWYYCLELSAVEVFEVLAGHIQKNAYVTKADYTAAYAKVQGTGLRFFDPQGYMTWEEHLNQICDTVRKEEMDAVFIDNLGFLTRATKNTFEVENVASARIKGLAQELEIPIILLHHLRKPESDSVEPDPNVHSIKGSGAILADASDAFILHHPVSDVEKQTRHEVGYLLSGKPRWGKGGKKYVRLEGSTRSYFLDASSNYSRPNGRKLKHDR
jgi:replicative DNA helicase